MIESPMGKSGTVKTAGADYFLFGFPIHGKAWDEFDLAGLLTLPSDEQAPFHVYAMRALADRFNAWRESAHTYAVEPVHAGQMLAMGALDEALRYALDYYCVKTFPDSLLEGLDHSGERLGAQVSRQPLSEFVRIYPPHAARTADADIVQLTHSVKDVRYSTGREIILLHLSMINRALTAFVPLFDDEELRRHSPYELLLECLESFFGKKPPFPGHDKDLWNFLQGPLRACPDSIEGQLGFIFEHWRSFLPAELLERLQFSRDVLKEETRMRGPGPGPAPVLDFREYVEWGYAEPARFTIDKDWMSNVVLIAKSTYVWLDQLSTRYQRPIQRLDQVPDEELDRLANWGFSGLWLIGVWERSPASRKIKQYMGNPEALASAYSLFDYIIAEDIGGDAAYQDLHDRAWRRGIRLASDMVPNHMGLYSRWVIEHPDWFVQLPYPPFPGYTFNGGDLSDDPRVGLFIEDGYWNHSDAAVVFKRVDRLTDDTRYIYHGNDGTSMPWNDTAQLNFQLPQVREAVVQTILHVVRKFPIVRFDAAMTLTKRHFQRLWFPKPGDGGAIPSRAEHGMSKADFDDVFPEEFWRQVVDRVQQEAPDTLLVAEAFWLMEGYFVRTLGMHRVYNSAFMNMLKMEENAKYRATIRNVLEFSPEVLKRFVNFMNNPDERTAIEQFGKEDKYYGVALLMVTMPGMPMFGHGQIEGFAEKYGMEYQRAYWDEQVDEHMVSRHEQEIFPLMRRRQLFSGVENFALYDFVAPGGGVDENVFAYSNRTGSQRGIILYNNAYSTTTGTISLSVAYNVGEAENKDLRRIGLGDALALDGRDNLYYLFRDHRSRLEFIRPAADLAHKGLTVTLHAYQYYAFLDFREIEDTDGTWGRLARFVGDNGVSSMEEAYAELILQPVHDAYEELVTPDMLRQLAATDEEPGAKAIFAEKMLAFLHAVTVHTSLRFDDKELVGDAWRTLEVIRRLPGELEKLDLPDDVAKYLLEPIPEETSKTLDYWRVPMVWAINDQVPKAFAASDYSTKKEQKPEDLLLTKCIERVFLALGCDEDAARLDATLTAILSAHPAVLDFAPAAGGAVAIQRMLENPVAHKYLFMNRHAGTVWANKEQLEKLVYTLFLASAITLLAEGDGRKQLILARYENARTILDAAQAAGYNVSQTITLLGRAR